MDGRRDRNGDLLSDKVRLNKYGRLLGGTSLDELLEVFNIIKGEKDIIGNGKVTKVVSDTKWGYVIEIDHGTFTARYCGLKQDGAVSIGETVSSGTIIGQLTNIPIESLDGIHLHFEAVKDGKNVDPIEMIQAQTQTNN